MKKRNLKIAAILTLVFAIAFTFLLGDSANVAAAEKLSDHETVLKYEDSFEHMYSTEYSGRVWTDKSVFSDESVTFSDTDITVQNDEDFLVSLSALATSDQVSGQTQAPVDVVFVIDISGSMSNADSNMDNDHSRIYNTVTALNNAIDELMNLNPYTRVGVVAFSSQATTLLPLDRYDKGNHGTRGTNYFTLNRSTGSGGNTTYLYTNVVSQTTNQTISSTNAVSGGTNTQLGMYTGMNMLANEDSIMATIDGQSIQRVPSVVLLSDGASTFSSDSASWWAPANNYNDGPGANEYDNRVHVVVGSGMKAIMTSAYMKDAIDRNYFNSLTTDAYETKVYTIGMGITDLPGEERNYAYAILDPGNYLYKNINSTAIKNIEDAYDEYSSDTYSNTTTVKVGSYNGWGREMNSTYTFTHPNTGYEVIDLNYVDSYYSANNANAVASVFEDIVTNISISAPKVPTEVSGTGDIQHDGYITFRDPIGEYLEVKGLSTIIWDDQVFENPTYNEETNTYVFEGDVETSVYGTQSLSNLIIQIEEDADGNQTLVAQIPASLIPLRVNTINLVKDENGNDAVDTHTSNGVLPIRILYNVGVKDNVIVDGVVNTDIVSQDYIDNNMNEDGTVNFYSNLFTGMSADEVGNIGSGYHGTVGDTTATFEPSSTNSFYYMQNDVVLYKEHNLETGEYVGTFSSLEELQAHTGLVYYPESYYSGNEIVEGEVSRTVEQILAVDLEVKDGVVVRTAGSTRFNRIMEFNGCKDDHNHSETATEFYVPSFILKDNAQDEYDGQFVVYLGNNGVLKANSVGSLVISKIVTADDGLTPDTDKEFTFTINLLDESDQPLTGTYSYVINNGDIETTGTITSGNTIKLKANDILTINGLPHNAKYSVQEAAENGYTTKVDNTASASVSGTIIAGHEYAHEYINHYSAEPVTIGGITGSKVISGRDWQANDTFTFRVNAVNGGPLPEYHEVSVAYKGAGIQDGEEVPFDFGNATFTKPGVYNYTIVEVLPSESLPGMTYTKTVYQVTITVADNGDGTLSASSKIEQIIDNNGNAMDPVEITDGLAQFINEFNAESVNYAPVARKLYIDESGLKPLTNGMFTFELKAITDGAPMPASANASNVGEEVVFGNITFDQDAVGNTYEYEISEIIPDPKQNGMTYDENVIGLSVEVYLIDDQVAVRTTYSNNKDYAEFTNEYEPHPVVYKFNGSKTLVGRNILETDVFEFSLSAHDQATKDALAANTVMIHNNKAEIANTAAADGKAVDFRFDDITFTKPGVYQFEISEVKGTLGGVTYDDSIIIATVTVTDNNGQLEASVVYTDQADGAHFTNTYVPKFVGEPISLDAVKTLTGQTLESGEFFIGVSANGGNPYYVANPDGVLNDGAYVGEMALLKDLTFDEAGTYIYTISEVVPQNIIKGFTYDLSVYEFKVVVTDNLDGTLTANTTLTKVKDELGQEVNELADSVVFNNKYEAEDVVHTTVNLIKELEGRPLLENDFTFYAKLIQGNNNGIAFAEDTDGDDYLEKNNEADGNISFGKITFSEVGTYVVEYAEIIPDGAIKNADGSYSLDGVTYDTHKLTVTYVVTDNQIGNLEVTRTNVVNSRIFTNTYDSTGKLDGETNLEVVKSYKDFLGVPWTDDKLKNHEFNFILSVNHPDTIEAVENGIVIMPENANSIKITVDNPDYANAFGDIIFNKAGTYEFAVREDTTNPITGVNYDEYARIIVVQVDEVLEDGKYTGELEATASVYKDLNKNGVYDDSDNASDLVFNNVYIPDEVTLYGHDSLLVTKQFTGRTNNEWLDTDVFNFMIEYGDDFTKEMYYNGEVDFINGDLLKINKSNVGHTHFKDITFYREGTYKFNITEHKNINPIAGVQYDEDNQRTIIVDVVDVDGVLVATINEDSDSLVFNNTYVPDPVILPGSEKLAVTKQLEGREWSDDYVFTFELNTLEDYSDKVKLGNNTIDITSTTENYTQYFDDVTFYERGTYLLSITETVKDYANIAFDTKETVVKVDVVDNQEGQLVIQNVTYEATNTFDLNTSPMTFVNYYTPEPIQVAFGGQKTMSGRELKDSDQFTFTLSADSYEPMPSYEAVMNVTNNGNTFNFGSITYYETGTYKYTIREAHYDANGVLSDPTIHNITVEVTYDAQTGKYVAESNYGNPVSVEFNNTYEHDPVPLSTVMDLIVTKNFTGRHNNQWLDTDSFKFVLTANEDYGEAVTMPENASGIIVTNQSENFKEAFGDIIFNEPGEYSFTITEVDTNIAGVTYDSDLDRVINVKVIDNQDIGKLEIVEEEFQADSLTFNNTYSYEPVLLSTVLRLDVTKNLTGRDWFDTDEFVFTLASNEDYGTDVELPANAAGVTITSQSENHTEAFGDIQFNEPGTYVFTVRETSGNDASIAYSTQESIITVNVVDNNEGQLVIESSVFNISENPLTFRNDYTPDAVNATFAGEKVINGREFIEDIDKYEFNIAIHEESNPVTPLPEVTSVTNGTDAQFAFGPVTYNDVGTYKYVITETKGNIGGITYDESEVIVTVDITYDSTTGQFNSPVITYTKGDQTINKAIFTNNYDYNNVVLEGKTNLEVTKNLTGRDWFGSDAFTFTLAAKDNYGDKVSLPANASGITVTSQSPDYKEAFGDIVFKQPGTYEFTIQEAQGTIDNIAYSNQITDITVKVVDNKLGDLVIESVTYSISENPLTFTNTYTPNAINVVFEGTKAMVGRELKETDIFTFTLEAKDNAPLPEVTQVNNNLTAIQFGTIAYNETGTYEYTIVEEETTIGGVTIDNTVVNVKVVVTYNNTDGQYYADVTYNGNETFEFVNNYDPNKVPLIGAENLVVTKNFTGRANDTWLDSDSFTFVLTANSDYGTDIEMPDNASGITITGQSADYSEAFGDIIFNEVGEYSFTISEVKGNIEGVTYDTDLDRIITVKVTDDGEDGQLDIALVSYDVQDNPLTFNNTYSYDPVPLSGKENLEVTKNLEGRKWFGTDEFTFTLAAKDNYGNKVNLPADADGITVTSESENYSEAFGDIIFNQPGTYEFVIQEVQGDIANIAYSNQNTEIKVVVVDNDKGQLVIESVTYSIPENPLTFTNIYTPNPVTVHLRGTKTMVGRELKETDSFTFTLAAKDNAPLPEVTQVNNMLDVIDFGTITYSEAGIYEYTIVEEDTDIGGVSKDIAIINVVVTVTYDENTGEHSLTVTYDGKETFEFVNEYDPNPVTLTGTEYFKVTKQFEGRTDNEWLDTDEFTFVLEAKEDYGENVVMPDNASGITVTNQSVNYQEAFGDITFNEVGTYEFTISEVKGNIEGITYDNNAQRTITVIVTDNGEDGQLDVESDGFISESLVFNNTYSTQSTTVQFNAAKVLEGRKLKANEFKFILENTDTKEKLEAYANENGEVSFAEIIYTEIGTHNYVVYEEDTELHNVAYDQTQYPITVEVKDDTKGQLYTVITGYEDTLVFNNFFTPDPIELNFSGLKTLTGRELYNEEFDFIIESVNNAPLPQVTKVTHDENGNFAFGTVRYVTEGTYQYTIKEDNNSIPGIAYDETAVTVTVEVIRTDDGILVPEVTYTKGEQVTENAVFTNRYNTEPSDEVVFDITKSVIASEGNEFVLQGGEFRFELIPSQNNINDPIAEVLTGTNDETGKVVFNNTESIKYSVAGTYVYTLRELSEDALPGISYDDSVYTIRVEVTDDESVAKLNTKVFINDVETNKVEFVNTYNPEKVNTIISGLKVLESEHKELEAEEFSFMISALTEDTILPEVTEVMNDESGYFQFDSIEYDRPGVHEYEIREIITDKRGYTYDQSIYRVKVEITHEQEDGILVVNKSITLNDEAKEDIKFINTYNPDEFTLDKDTTIAIEADKVLLGRDGLAIQDNEFTFKLLDENGNIVVDNNGNNLVVGVKDGQIVFDQITYTKAGTYNYTIVEVVGNALGITYDDSVFAVRVDVEDLGGYLDGQITYFENNQQVERAVFTNEYEPVIDAFIKFNAQKELIGRKLLADEFRFVLENTETGEKLYAYANENGVVEFDRINYSETGTYTYKVYEEKGILNNVTYDDTIYDITVEVKDDLQGNLVAEVLEQGTGYVFTNIYTPDPLNINLTINKHLVNKEESNISLDQFEFELTGEDKSQIIKGSKDGMTIYGLSYDESYIGKTMNYTVKEIDTDVDDVTYDKSEYYLSVTILQNEDGTLYAKYAINGKATENLELDFNNTYTPPVETNDNTNITLWTTLMMVSAMAITILRKKEEF